jgi:hypothetical protein
MAELLFADARTLQYGLIVARSVRRAIFIASADQAA